VFPGFVASLEADPEAFSFATRRVAVVPRGGYGVETSRSLVGTLNEFPVRLVWTGLFS